MSSPLRAAPKTKARRTLLMIVAVFALPLVLAWVFTGPLDWRPANTVNHGVLVKPPMLLESYGVMDATGAALAVDSIAGDWFLVVLRGSACAEPCMRWLQIAERIQIAVGRDAARVTLALLGPDTLLFKESRESWRLPQDGKLIGALSRATGDPPVDALLLIVDHRGRVVLAYPPDEDGRGVLKDLKRLLRASPR